MLKAKVGHLKSGSNEKQFPSIQELADLKKLGQYFKNNTPELLQQEAWFILSYHLGLRGREVHQQIQRD